MTHYCYIHGKDETGPEEFYLICPECSHLYPTIGNLRKEYREILLTLWSMNYLRIGYLWRALTVRIDKIRFCRYCMHDL